jgi:hypothetical protein
MQAATDWLGEYRRFWEQRLDQLDAYLQTLQQQQKEPKNE